MTYAPSRNETRLVDGLLAGDEASFEHLVRMHHESMVRVAQIYVSSRAVAEEVAQEAWLGVLAGIGRFERRSSLKTWIFRILSNTAKTRAERERRTVPFSALQSPGLLQEPAVEPERFLDLEHPRHPGHWTAHPASWRELPEERLSGRETRKRIEDAIGALPAGQRAVISLRDVEGWSSEEVCNALGVSETNQRVLLHRARSKVRKALEQYLEPEGSS